MTLDGLAAERLKTALATVAAVPVTPFGPGGGPDWDAHARVITRMVDAGISVVTPNGNTGEFSTLTADEARRATESAVAAAAGRASVLAGVGLDIPGAIAAGQRAQAAGAEMIMVHQPASPYLSADGWVDYHQAIADALPGLGVVLYIRDARIAGRHIGRLGE